MRRIPADVSLLHERERSPSWLRHMIIGKSAKFKKVPDAIMLKLSRAPRETFPVKARVPHAAATLAFRAT